MTIAYSYLMTIAGCFYVVKNILFCYFITFHNVCDNFIAQPNNGIVRWEKNIAGTTCHLQIKILNLIAFRKKGIF